MSFNQILQHQIPDLKGSWKKSVKVASDKLASDKVASGHLLQKSSLLRKVVSTVNKGNGRSARPHGLPSRGRSAP